MDAGFSTSISRRHRSLLRELSLRVDKVINSVAETVKMDQIQLKFLCPGALHYAPYSFS